MERHFHEELRRLEQKLQTMSDLVESRVCDAVRALVERRPELAARVATGDDEVNTLEVEIDDLTLKLLALQSPLASDLRQVRSAIKVNIDLERVGDQAVNIAEVAIRSMALPPLKPLLDLDQLAEHAVLMLHDSMAAFAAKDVALARSVLERDGDAYDMRDSIFRVVLTHMMVDPATVERALGLIFVSRALERVSDHATNIAEDVVFLVEGRVVGHEAH
jgi:phosphate transport system protein